jgi:dihydropteroate synthase
MHLRDHFSWGSQTYVMGILNLSPDSFSGDGFFVDDETGCDAAVEQGQRFVSDGAHILDVGGESTRPGSIAVSTQEEMRRVLPVIEALASKLSVPIAVDTYKADVAAAALECGASIVNDVWGLRMDAAMGRVVAKYNAPLILMHNRSHPSSAVQQARLGGRYVGSKYDDLLGDISIELLESVHMAKSVGIPGHQIIVDPGIGFGKTVEQNLCLVNSLEHFRGLGFPILIGPSRKSFIGFTLDLAPQERLEGTAAAVAIAIARGADIVRVHDVRAMARVARMTDAMVRQ